jgi:transforming growth factor-beta-induced protein
MKSLRVVAVVAMLVAFALGQEQRPSSDLLNDPPTDLLRAAEAEGSLNMFVTAAQSSGLAKMLKEEGPFTVFALSDRAFINLAKEDRDTLLNNHFAMHILLSRYIVRGVVGGDAASLSSARTLIGVKLRTDDHEGLLYVNGARLRQSEIACCNGAIHVLDDFDPMLVHEAVVAARK